jgi:hypothetical protein
MAVSLRRWILLVVVVVPLSLVEAAAWVAAVASASAAAHTATEIPRFASVAEYQAAALTWNAKDHHCTVSASCNDDAPPWHDIPVIIEGVLSAAECDSICDEIMNLNGSPAVTVQRRRTLDQSRAKTTLSEVSLTLDQAVNAMLQSQHQDARWCFAEGFVERNAPDLSQRLRRVRERVWSSSSSSSSSSSETIDSLDWFAYFPAWAKPAEDCLILSGVGSTSTLHRDPFEWTGTSLGLEGTKVWRFVNPHSNSNSLSWSVHDVDALLQSYRLPSHAWNENDKDSNEGDDSVVLSAGWQSDYSLYRTSTIPPLPLDSMQSSRSLSHHDQDELATSLLSGLVPDVELLSVIQDDPPAMVVWATVQRAGDLVVIPAHWWHQTYALCEPCVSISSQRCGSSWQARRVFSHVMDTIDTYTKRRTRVAGRQTNAVEKEKTRNAILDSVCKEAEPRASVERFFAWLDQELTERR